MATPLHHDQPQRALRTPEIHGEEPTEKSKDSRYSMTKIGPYQNDDNLANQPDFSYRRGAPHLPPRPLPHLQPQQHLRQRRSGSPHAPLDESSRHATNSPQSQRLRSGDRPHARRLLNEPRIGYADHSYSETPPESRIHHARSIFEEFQPSYPHQPQAGTSPERRSHETRVTHPVVSTCDNQIYRANTTGTHPSWLRHHPEQQSSTAVNPIDSDALDAKEGEKYQPSQSLLTPSSLPRDYRAAVMRDSHVMKHHQHVNHEDYFCCTEDGNQKIQPKILGEPLSEQHQHNTLDFSEFRNGMGSGNTHAVAEQNEQTRRPNHEATSSSERLNQEDQTSKGDHMSSEEGSHVESPQRELSRSSSDDSYYHISKESVECDYPDDFQLATTSEHQAQSQQQPFSTPVYDYSRAGVTFIEVDSEEQESGSSNKLCNDKKAASNDGEGIHDHCHDGMHDNTRGPDLQQKDVESPPLFLGFNHFSMCFSCGTSKGLRVYDVGTMKECFSFMIGGVSFVELLPNTDSLLLVGGGPNPSFPANEVVMWDIVKGKSSRQISHKYPVLAIKARQDQLVVVLEKEVYFYNLSNSKILFHLNTTANIKGLCALSTKEGPLVLACPGLKRGEVRIEHIGPNTKRGEIQTRDSKVISAHDSGLACITLNATGSLLATASDRGTLVRVFSTKDGAALQELRRGTDRAEIYSLAFSLSSDWLAVSSDKGTVHVFGLRTTSLQSTDTNAIRNPGSTLSFIRGVLPKYFSSEWSYAQFKLREETKSIVAFGQEECSVLVLGTDGSFHKCSFDAERGGDMKQVEFWKFSKPMDPEA